MKNFQITAKEDNKKYWISRSMAVVGIILLQKSPSPFTFSLNPKTSVENYFLISKRGAKSPDFVGCWQVTCGYLDFDETLLGGVMREVWEELGIDLEHNLEKVNDNGDPYVKSIELLEIVDDPNRDARQNVSFRYLIKLDYDWVKSMLDKKEINIDTKSRGGEEDEISEIKILKSSEIDKIEDKDWAFNHKELLKSLSKCPH